VSTTRSRRAESSRRPAHCAGGGINNRAEPAAAQAPFRRRGGQQRAPRGGYPRAGLAPKAGSARTAWGPHPRGGIGTSTPPGCQLHGGRGRPRAGGGVSNDGAESAADTPCGAAGNTQRGGPIRRAEAKACSIAGQPDRAAAKEFPRLPYPC